MPTNTQKQENITGSEAVSMARVRAVSIERLMDCPEKMMKVSLQLLDIRERAGDLEAAIELKSLSIMQGILAQVGNDGKAIFSNDTARKIAHKKECEADADFAKLAAKLKTLKSVEGALNVEHDFLTDLFNGARAISRFENAREA